MKIKTRYNDVPFVPSADCSHYGDCREDAYQQGREDAIDECSEALKKWSCNKEDLRSVFEVLEELKEQKNDRLV